MKPAGIVESPLVWSASIVMARASLRRAGSPSWRPFGPMREKRKARSSFSIDIAAATPGAGGGAPRTPSPTTK